MFPAEILIRMRDDPTYEKYLGPVAFAQEMQNEAIDDNARIIKRDWIYGQDNKNLYSYTAMEERWRASHPPDSKSWLETNMKQIIMAVDPAISEKTTADYFAIVVIGIDHDGNIWILDMFRDRIGDIDVQVSKIIEMAKHWKPDKLKVESVAYQAGLSRAVRNAAAKAGTHLPIFEVRPDKDKFRRAVIHSANFAGSLVHTRQDHPLFDAFVEEILNFPVGEHDDMFDAYMHAAEDSVQKKTVRVFSRKAAGF
jgi:predicted phage terminase large subunit-like protein